MYFHQTLVHAVCQFAHTKLNQLEYFSSCPTAQLSATRLADYLRIGTLSNDDDEKNEFASFQTLSRLFARAQFVKCRRLFLGLNS